MNHATEHGLIISTDTRSSTALEDLIDRTGWPALLAANAGALTKELDTHRLLCSLFWVHRHEQIRPTATLLAWLKSRRPTLQRIAVAYGQDHDSAAEAELRAAGAHAYWSIVDRVDELVEQLLRPLLERQWHSSNAASRPPPQTAINSPVVDRAKPLRETCRPP
jgi:hypothetical protein